MLIWYINNNTGIHMKTENLNATVDMWFLINKI